MTIKRPSASLHLLILSGASVLAASSAACAGTAAESNDYATANSAASPDEATSAWEFSIAPYAWLAGLNADVGVPGTLPDVHIHTPFRKILHSLKFAGMVMGTARHDRFVAVGDLVYVSLANSKDLGIRDPSFVTGSLAIKQFMSTLDAGYRVADNGTNVDLMGGMRIVAINEDLTVSGPIRTASDSASKTLVDPIVSARISGRFDSHWGYNFYGDIGGFGVSSKLTWQLMGVINYRISSGWTAAAGWRHLSIDTSKGGFKFDGAMDGPIMGVSYRF